MEIKGFITVDNVYYEAEHQLSDSDIEVPLRPDGRYIWNGNTWVINRRKVSQIAINDLDYHYLAGRADYAPSGENNMSSGQKAGVLENISWKDLITIFYFLAGLAGLWIHMSERTLILEQKIQVQEKEITTLRDTHKEDQAKAETQLKQLATQVTELSMLLMRKSINSKPE